MSANPRINLVSKQNAINNTVEYSYDNAKRPTSQSVDNDTIIYTYDQEGNILTATNTTGTASFTYDNHYGTIIDYTKTTETNNPYAYTSRELDTDELYYYRARYYDATLESFFSEDSIGFFSKDFNFYRYVKNSPISYTNPHGFEDCGVINKDTGWYETMYSIMKDPIAIYLGTIGVKINGKLTFAGCRWRLVKNIEEERKIRTYIICEICNTERITSDTGWVIENRTRNGAIFNINTLGIGFNLTGGSGSYDNPKKFERISCPNPVTGIWCWH